MADGDVDSFLQLHDPGFVMRDHRSLGFAELDLDAYRQSLGSVSMFEREAIVIAERVLRLDPSVSTCTAQRLVFTSSDGSQDLIRSVGMTLIDPVTGLITGMEFFGEGQVDEAVARFDELMAERGHLLHNEASQRAAFVNSWLRRGDHERVSEALADDTDFVDEDGDALGLAPVERREVIAVRGDRLALVQASGPGHAFQVEEIDEDGRLAAVRQFAVADLAPAVVHLEGRYLEVGAGGLSAAEDFIARWRLAVLRSDRGWFEANLGVAYHLTDHRELGFGTVGRDVAIGLHTSVDDRVPLCEEVLMRGEQATLTRYSLLSVDTEGHTTRGGEALVVASVEGGLGAAVELFGRDDVDAARLRYEELERDDGGLSTLT